MKNETINHLPLQALGYHNVPAYPIILSDMVETLIRLSGRNQQVRQAKFGLSTEHTIQGQTANAYAFAFGKEDQNPKQDAIDQLLEEIQTSKLTEEGILDFVKTKLADQESMTDETIDESLTGLSLDNPDQFALSWSTYNNLYRNASENVLGPWSETLSDWKTATKQFFPIIAHYGAAYNLLILQKVTEENLDGYKSDFSTEWTDQMDDLYEQGSLYIIDLRIYKILNPQRAKGAKRFTPATFTWLKRDSHTKEISPIAIHVSRTNKRGKEKDRFYDIETCRKSTWLYALQAAKTSVTVYGIWLGHVYQWHLVTASMVMTMFNNLNEDHPIYKILAPQSKYIIGFNDVLLVLWRAAAPPTSIKTSTQFLELIDTFAENRLFFDDDPTVTIEKLGLSEADFTVSEPWDMYPIVGYLLKIWETVQEYTDVFVENTYPDDAAVEDDSALQDWISAAGKRLDGNIDGLPQMRTKQALKDVLSSMLYRITAHGISRMDSTANPAMTFVGNFPPCLQRSDIPNPRRSLSTEKLLEYLPKTGTIGEMITFYYTFVDSAPYEPIIPLTGVDENLFFEGGIEAPMNHALMVFRKKLIDFMANYARKNKIPYVRANAAQIHQWPMNIET